MPKKIMIPTESQNNIRKISRISKIPNEFKKIYKIMPKILPNNYLQNTKCLPNKYQNNTKRISKIIPKITTFNTKQMLKEYQRITKIIPKESKIYIK